MKTKPWAMGLVLLTTVLTSAGQVFYKLGTNALPQNPVLLDYVFNTATHQFSLIKEVPIAIIHPSISRL
jgi:hypothetical protein